MVTIKYLTSDILGFHPPWPCCITFNCSSDVLTLTLSPTTKGGGPCFRAPITTGGSMFWPENKINENYKISFDLICVLQIYFYYFMNGVKPGRERKILLGIHYSHLLLTFSIISFYIKNIYYVTLKMLHQDK